MHTRQKAAAARAVSPDITTLGTPTVLEIKYNKPEFIVPSSPPLGPDMVKKPGYLVYNTTDLELVEKLKKFEGIDESIFLTERTISKECRKMVCDCYLSKEDIARGEIGCTDDCLNRLLMVECGSRCPIGDRCTNRKFQKKEYCKLEVFRTDKKGHGLRTTVPLPAGGFVIEYVGEVLDQPGFLQRTKAYAKEKQEHFYFMALKADAIIDATRKGNCSRFINHSCDPNCETQKWTVNGELRIGFFCLRDLDAGEEITFDYRFQRYGKKAQKCYCQAEQCRGWIGGEEENQAPAKLEPWQFVEGAKRLFEDWTALKEAFRIPKTERVEEIKEQEREADTGVNTSSKESTNGRDNDSRHRFSRLDRLKERRVPVVDSSYNGHYPRPIRPYNSQYNNMSKEQRRLMFAARVAQEEKDEKLRRMQDQMVALHQSRCANLNLDPATTPIVDPSGIYYLDPKTISWKEINPQDPDIPPELLLFVHASQHPYLPPPVQEVFIPEPAEVAFPPWPVGLPPPPPLPPTVLPSGWKMAVDSEGRCYYYDIRTGHCQWDPPSEPSEVNCSDSSDSDVPVTVQQEEGTEVATVQPEIENEAVEEEEPEVRVTDENVQAIVKTPEKKSRSRSRLKKRLLEKKLSAKSLKEKKASEEYFRNNIANVIVQYLNPYRKPDCKNGHITSTEHFKHLARKLTHMITTKEVKHCKNAKTLVVNDSVKHKTKEFVKKYMSRFAGRDYMPSPQELVP